jgi:hypothetical protein
MVAWRARIGLIKPTHRGKSFAYWYNHAPEGVEIVPTFIGFRSEKRESFLEGFKKAEALAVQLKEVGCDIIAVSGTPPFLLKGLDFERQWAADLSEKIGLPVVTPMEPHAIALQTPGSAESGGRDVLRQRTESGDRQLFLPFRFSVGTDAGFEHDRRELGALRHFTYGFG